MFLVQQRVQGGPYGATSAANSDAMAELDAVLAQLGGIADRLGTRAVIAQYEADIDDPALTRVGTSLEGSCAPLPRFLPIRDILRINFNMHGLVPPDVVPRRLARSARMPTDDNLATTLPYAPSLRAALDLVARYGDAVVPWYRRRVVLDADEIRIFYGPIVPLGRIESLSTEIALATIHRIVETFMGDRISGARVNFAIAPVSSPVALAERFSCPITIGGEESFMAIPAAWGVRPSPYHDTLQWLDGVARCDADIRALQDFPIVGRVRSHVLQALDAGRIVPVAETARALGMSPRSLVRALARGGTTHHRIVEAERERRARQLLAQSGIALSAIVERLGFPDQSSFGRKCRTWFGESPARLRQQMALEQRR